MVEIKINGKAYNIGYNLNTAVAYERLTGKSAFELQQFQDGKLEPQLALGYAMLLSNNDPANVPDMDELLQSITDIKSTQAFLDSVAAELKAYFLPGKDEKPKNDEAPKND